MAASPPTPVLPAQPPGTANLAEGANQTADANGARALVRAESKVAEAVESPFHPLVLGLPVEVDVSLPVREYRVRHLLALAPGDVIESQWNNGIDLPLAAGDVQLAWTEFEVVETRLAVRVTRVA
jgi:flagellar motor switch/type III secretory pathway protein FliN